MPLHIEGRSFLINTFPCASLGDVGFHGMQDPPPLFGSLQREKEEKGKERMGGEERYGEEEENKEETETKYKQNISIFHHFFVFNYVFFL